MTVEVDDDDEPRADAGDLVQLAPVGSRRVKDPISVDEVLDMHRLLERFQGGTVELLALLEDGPRE